jgi:hypothetical protein
VKKEGREGVPSQATPQVDLTLCCGSRGPDFITGGAAHGTVPQSVASDDNILDEVDAARPSLTSEQLRMVDNPEEHLNIIRIWCQTPWIVKHWPRMKAFVKGRCDTGNYVYVKLCLTVVLHAAFGSLSSSQHLPLRKRVS